MPGVGAPGDQGGHRHASRIGLLQHGSEEVELGEVDLGLGGPDERHLDLRLGPDDAAQLLDHLFGTETREQAAVELNAHLARDDVDLQAAADDRRVDRVVQRRVEPATHRSEVGEGCVGSHGIQERANATLQRLG